MSEIVIFAVGFLAACFVGFLFAVGHWMTHAEVGVDPFADLPAFDDDEAQHLLETGT